MLPHCCEGRRGPRRAPTRAQRPPALCGGSPGNTEAPTPADAAPAASVSRCPGASCTQDCPVPRWGKPCPGQLYGRNAFTCLGRDPARKMPTGPTECAGPGLPLPEGASSPPPSPRLPISDSGFLPQGSSLPSEGRPGRTPHPPARAHTHWLGPRSPASGKDPQAWVSEAEGIHGRGTGVQKQGFQEERGSGTPRWREGSRGSGAPREEVQGGGGSNVGEAPGWRGPGDRRSRGGRVPAARRGGSAGRAGFSPGRGAPRVGG